MSQSIHSSFDADQYKNTVTQQPLIKPEMVLKNFAREYPLPEAGSYQNFLMSMGKLFGSCGIFCCLCLNPYKLVDQGEVGLVQRFGALARTVEPGMTYVNTWAEKLTRVSVKVNIREIPAQSCFTRDNVSVIITSVVYYNIIDPQKAIYSISDIHNAIVERTQTTMRDVIGGRVLQDVVEKRDEIAESIEHIIAKTAFEWGVNIESILIKDMTLPDKVMSSLSMAAEAKRIGEGKIINAKAEVESAKLMRKAADILASKPAMQIRYLDALQNMSKNAGSRVIFMPSLQEVEKQATAGSGGPNPAITSDSADIEENTEWASSGAGKVANTIGLQEAMKF